MKLMVISLPEFFVGEADCVNALFHAGLQFFHLRKPTATAEAVDDFLDDIEPRYYDRISIHNHHSVAVARGVGGVHLNAAVPMPPAQWTGRVTRSCHTIDELAKWIELCDYLSLSPIFDSISKSGYRAAFTPQVLAEARSRGLINDKVIALGGVTPELIPEVRKMGFGGAAILGGIWPSESPEEACQKLAAYQSAIEDMPVSL